MINKFGLYGVIATFIFSAVFFYTNPDQFLSDNSLFYPVVAQHIYETGVSTFNGYIETYGYQPSWMLVSVLSVFIAKSFSFDLLMVIGFFYHLFLAGALVVVFKIAKRWTFFSAPIVSLIFIFMFISNGVLHNMESAMALFFVLLSIYYALSIKHLKPESMFVLGVLVGLTFLSRLDLIFFGLITTLYTAYLFRKELFSSPQVVLFYLLGFLLVTTPYFFYNELHFGALLPISNRLSQGFSTLSYAMANIYPYGTVSLAIAVLEWGVAWTAKTRKAREIILIMSLSTIFQIIYVAFFQHPQSWYFITGFVNFAVISGYLLQRFNVKWVTNLAIGALVVVTIASAYLKTVSNYALSAHVLKLYQEKVGTATWDFSGVSQKLEYANDVKKVLPAGTTVYAGFFPGALAYYAHLKVFAANGLSDGLIANSSYEEVLQHEGVGAVMEKYNVAYAIVPLSRGNVLWFKRIGLNVTDNDKYDVIFYSKRSPKVCGLMHYGDEVNVTQVRLGYASTGHAGIFPVKKVVACSEKAKDYEQSGFYSTIIGK